MRGILRIDFPDDIKAVSMKFMPYCFLMMTFHSLSTVGGDKEAIKMRVDPVLRQRFLPAIDTASDIMRNKNIKKNEENCYE